VKLIAAATAACCLLATPATARDWWMIDASTASCHNTKVDPYRAVTINPDTFMRVWRSSHNKAPQESVIREDQDDPNSEVVAVIVGTDQASMVWATSLERCNLLVQYFEKEGEIADPKDTQ
jgi:hypothetical protein